jgi:hypothetical protein
MRFPRGRERSKLLALTSLHRLRVGFITIVEAQPISFFKATIARLPTARARESLT